MKVLLVLAHPESQSFNGAMHRAARQALEAAGHEVLESDLYALGFDPVSGRNNFVEAKDPSYLKPQVEEMHASETNGFAPDLTAEMEKLEAADLVVWQFPLWWFGLPAILKGWVDRVFAMGRFYGGGRYYETGMLKGKRALVSVTTGGPKEAYIQGGFNGDLNAVLRPIQRGMLEFVGLSVLEPHVVYSPAHVTQEEREAELERYAARLTAIESESPIEVGPY